MKKAVLALCILTALLLPAAPAGAVTGTDVAALPTADALDRNEPVLGNGGKWQPLWWATAATKTGADYGNTGWGTAVPDIYPKVAGAYWTAAPSGTAGVASGAMVAGHPAVVGGYGAVWLNMPNPGSTKSGYQLRWTQVAGSGTYSVKISRWVGGFETELAATPSVSLPVGTRMVLADTGSTVTAWKNSGSTFAPLLTASDSTYSSGNAGIEASGNTRLLLFRVGSFDPKVYWGAWMGGGVYSPEHGDGPWDGVTWDLFEEHAGKPVSLVHFGQPAPWKQAFASYPLELTRARGALPVVSMDSNEATLKEIAEGSKDSWLEAWADAAAGYAHPFFFRWNTQMNGTWSQYGKEAAASPETFVKAWRHFYEVAEAQGATNVTWVWCPNTSYTGSTSLASLYPGDAYVDWTCISGFNAGTNPLKSDSWKSFSTVFKATYDELASLAPSKPVMIGETASSEFGGSKASWITDALQTQVPLNFPKVKAFVWWNKNDSGMDWPIESSASAQSAFATSIAPDLYAENEFGSMQPLSPISPLPRGVAPGMATVTSATPAGPANDNTVAVKGTAPAGATAIHLYTESNCGGMPVASSRPATYASSGITATVADNTTTTFYAEATNSWGWSPCSATSVTYVEDSTPPAAPKLSSTSPPSPANNNAPKVVGSAEAGSIVRLYTNNTCTSAVAAIGTAAALASPGLPVSVADNTATMFYAKATDAAGNVSPCSTGLAYVEDSIAPAAPTVSSTNPASGANDNVPKVLGSAPGSTTVKVYANATCTGTPAATGSAAAFASPGLTVNVANNTTTTFRATATDAAGNASACSATSATYKEVSPAVYWGPWLSGNVYEREEQEEGKVPKKWGDAPWDKASWDRYETHAGGKHVSLIHFGQPSPWNMGSEPLFQPAPLKLTRERGALPLMDMGSWNTTLQAIAKGEKDGILKEWAEKVAAYKYPFFFRWNWEMNGDWFPWGQEAQKNPQVFKEAWWRFHDIAEAAGASNITWVWCPNTSYPAEGERPASTSLSALYPGKASEGKGKYVDWTCMDGYNWGEMPAQPGGWKSFTQVFSQTYNEILALAPDKPMMIAETGSTEYGGSKSTWITNAFTTELPNNFPEIRAVSWFNKYEPTPTGIHDWPIETSPAATSAFASAISSPFYVENEFTNPPLLAPIQPLP